MSLLKKNPMSLLLYPKLSKSLPNLLLSLKSIIQEGTKNHPILTIRGVGLTHQISTSSKPSQTLDYLVNKMTNYMLIITKALTLSQIHSHSI